MGKTRDSNKISISAVRRANERLIRRDSDSGRFVDVKSVSRGINVKTIYSGRTYGIHLSEDTIKEVYAKSLKSVLKKK